VSVTRDIDERKRAEAALHEREAESGAGARRAALGLAAIESIEDSREVLCGDAEAVVLDGHENRTVSRDTDPNGDTRPGMSQRVSQQVPEGLPQPGLHAQHVHFRTRIQPQAHALFVRHRLVELDEILEQRAQRDGLALLRLESCIGLREQQGRGERIRQRSQLVEGVLKRLAQGLL